MVHLAYHNPAPVGMPADPLLALVEAYRAEQRRLNENDDATDDRFIALFDRLEHATPPCRSVAGAMAALRLVADGQRAGISDMHDAVIASVLRFAGGTVAAA